MGIAERLSYPEWCPSCGDGVDTINPVTGFCFKCSPYVIGYIIPCETCGKDFIPYQNSRRACITCRRAQWLIRNGDAVERVMQSQNVSALEAITLVHDDNRPTCVLCGDDIKHGTRGRTIFCGKRDECRRAGIRYYNYRKRNNMTDDDALEKALHGTITETS